MVEGNVAPTPIGLMHQMWSLAEREDAPFLEEVVRAVKVADELGYDSVWLAEHHYARPDEPFSSRLALPELLLARLIPETRRIRLATGVKLLLLDDPVRTAEALRLLDVLSEHRVGFGVGQGSPDELGTIALSADDRRRAFRDALSRLSTCLGSGSTETGRQLTPTGAAVGTDSVWVGVRDDPSIALAAELGMHFLVGEAEVAQRQADFVAAYRAAGGCGEARGARLVCVAPSDEAALATARVPGCVLFERFCQGRYYREAVQAGLIPPAPPEDDVDRLARVDYVVGSPDTVTERLLGYLDTTKASALNVLVHTPGMPAAAAERSLELFMGEVAGRLAPALAANAAVAAT